MHLLGLLQRPDINYSKIYAPIADLTVVRALLVNTLSSEWHVHQKNVKCAFLNRVLVENIYMCLLGLICKLEKSSYEIKQAPRVWNNKFTADLRKSGFFSLINAKVSSSEFLCKSLFFLVCYVDDIVILTQKQTCTERSKGSSSESLPSESHGRIGVLSSVKVGREHGKAMLSQKAYLESVRSQYRMSDCKSAPNAMMQPAEFIVISVPSETQKSETGKIPFRAAIGSLLYFSTCTRPDTTVAVSILVRHSQDPSPTIWQAVKLHTGH